MEKLKKIILLIAGPGVLFGEVVAIFIHLFTSSNTKPWIIGGLIVFFLIFIPFYSVEFFRQNFKNEKRKSVIRFKRKQTRTEWEGGNIHGKTPAEVERPGKLIK